LKTPTTDQVRELVARQFPQWSGLEVTPVSSAGTDHWIFRLGKDLAARMPRNRAAARQTIREQSWLARLSDLPLAIPVVRGAGRRDANTETPWSIVDWMDGHDATQSQVSDWQTTAIALGKFIAALRLCDTKDAPLAGPDNGRRGTPLASLDSIIRKAIDALADLYDCDQLASVWNTALAAPAWSSEPVWVHGDLHAGNLIVRDHKLAAVIDFGLMAAGDPACDVAPAWSYLPADVRNIFRNAAEVDDATWARGKGWGLYIGVIALSYYRDRNPVLAGIARTAIEAVIADADMR
jgi:aminoglycoside phosphotransferase (APT) family kinase protein